MAKLSWGIKGGKELSKYFDELGISDNPGAEQTCCGGTLGGTVTGNYYYLTNGKWDYDEYPHLEISLENYLSNKERYKKESYE